jgi:hypothetical protein
MVTHTPPFLTRDTDNAAVVEANNLMKRVIKRMSYVDPQQDLNKVDFFLTSTEFEGEKYGECADRFKERLGVTGSSDLFVIRNVVMSPFPTAGNFVSDLADTFRTIVKDEVKNCQLRNSIDPAIHRFVVQGASPSGKLFLAYQPYFHEADCLTQLILAADLDAEAAAAYNEARKNSTKAASFHVTTAEMMRLDDILLTGQFAGIMSRVDLHSEQWKFPATLNHLRVIKRRSLATKHLDADYPATFSPFYLYGTQANGNQHVSHVLTRAPNINLAADTVELQLDIPVSELAPHIEEGCFVFATEIREKSMQPFSDMTDLSDLAYGNFFFLPDSTLQIEVYADPKGAEDSGPGLLEGLGECLAKGSMKLAGKVYIDSVQINEDGLDGEVWNGDHWVTPLEQPKEHSPLGMLSGRDSEKEHWLWPKEKGDKSSGVSYTGRHLDVYLDAKVGMGRVAVGGKKGLLKGWMREVGNVAGGRH